jgi:hypothetical protein
LQRGLRDQVARDARHADGPVGGVDLEVTAQAGDGDLPIPNEDLDIRAARDDQADVKRDICVGQALREGRFDIQPRAVDEGTSCGDGRSVEFFCERFIT